MKWFKAASNIHTNPKIVEGGRDALDVWFFLLAKNAEEELDGRIPARFLAPSYVARLTMMTVAEAAEGLAACERVDLIATEPDGSVRMVGWDDEWSPLKGAAARQRKYAAKKRAEAKARRRPILDVVDGFDVFDRLGKCESANRMTSSSRQPDASLASRVTGVDAPEESRDSGAAPPNPPLPSGSSSVPLVASPEAQRESVVDPGARVGAVPVPDPVRALEPRGGDAKLAAVEAVWRDQEAGITALQADGVDPLAPRLGFPGGLAKVKLAQRIAEQAAEGRGYEAAEADCRRCLATWFAEARERHRLGLAPALKYLKGSQWTRENFERALMTTPEEAVQRVRELKARERRLAAVNPDWVAKPVTPSAARAAEPAKEPPPRLLTPEEAAAAREEAIAEIAQANPDLARRYWNAAVADAEGTPGPVAEVAAPLPPDPGPEPTTAEITAVMADFVAAGRQPRTGPTTVAREVTKLFAIGEPQPTRRAYAAPGGAGEADGAEPGPEDEDAAQASPGPLVRFQSVPWDGAA